jgi:2-polyprenyl-3-methyl-5-hydroxy-6-metoxy-1,4-benzoquinol methylase
MKSISSDLQTKCDFACRNPSDINEHIPTLRSYAEQCAHITEFGVRWVVSTWALLAGKPGHMVSYDINYHNDIEQVKTIAAQNGVGFRFIQGSTLKVDIEETDLLFIDTLHTYNQLRQELMLHADKVRKYIILHDTNTYAHRGMEPNVGGDNVPFGLMDALAEFQQENPHWKTKEIFWNNNGLTVLERTPVTALPDLADWHKLYFQKFLAFAPPQFISYGGYHTGLPNGTACSFEAIREFIKMVPNKECKILNAGAGASSFVLRRFFPNVICVDMNKEYLEVVRQICASENLSTDNFITNIEEVKEADCTFYDLGDFVPEGRLKYFKYAFDITKHFIYYDDADDRPFAFPSYRKAIQELGREKKAKVIDVKAAYDTYGRWGIALIK